MRSKWITAVLRAVSLLLVLLLALPLASCCPATEEGERRLDVSYRSLRYDDPLSAVLLRWGDLCDEVYDDGRQTYVGVRFQLVCLYQATFDEDDFSRMLRALTVRDSLLVPAPFAEQLRAGETALVCLETICEGETTGDGASSCGYPLLGVRYGKQKEDGQYASPPVFPIKDGCVTLPDDAYCTVATSYAMPAMDVLDGYKFLAERILQDPDFYFREGMPVACLSDYFALICGEYAAKRYRNSLLQTGEW